MAKRSSLVLGGAYITRQSIGVEVFRLLHPPPSGLPAGRLFCWQCRTQSIRHTMCTEAIPPETQARYWQEMVQASCLKLTYAWTGKPTGWQDPVACPPRYPTTHTYQGVEVFGLLQLGYWQAASSARLQATHTLTRRQATKVDTQPQAVVLRSSLAAKRSSWSDGRRCSFRDGSLDWQDDRSSISTCCKVISSQPL